MYLDEDKTKSYRQFKCNKQGHKEEMMHPALSLEVYDGHYQPINKQIKSLFLDMYFDNLDVCGWINHMTAKPLVFDSIVLGFGCHRTRCGSC